MTFAVCAMEEDETEHYITCRVCYLPFDDDQIKPKSLSCSHTACLQCLKTIFNHGAVIKCPVCRRSDRLQNGVEQLPTNQAVLHIIQLNEKLRCQNLTCLSERMNVESLVKELVDFYSPEETVFFRKLEMIIKFIAKDLNKSLKPVWTIQDGWSNDNGTYVLKLHQSLLSCVNELAPEHVDFLIGDIQARWITSDNVQRYALLNFVRTLAIEVNHDHTPVQILDLIGEFVRCPDTSADLIDPCIESQYKILDHCWNSDLVSHWILNCIQIIQQREQRRSVTAAMKLMRHLCYLFAVKSAACNDHYQRSAEFTELVWLKYREIYAFLDKEWHLLDQAVAEIVSYMSDVRSGGTEINETHSAAVQERLTFILMILKYGHLVLDDSTAVSVWSCLVDGAVSASDSDTCFKWFDKLIEMNAVDSKGHQRIFHHHILKLDPRREIYQTVSFVDCFQRFFRAVQCSDGDTFTDDIINPLPALEFLWKIVQYSDRSVAEKAYDLLKETVVYLGSRLLSPSIEIRDNAVGNCLDRLKGECFAGRKIPRCLAGNQTKLMDRLADLLEGEIPKYVEATERQHRQELTVGIHTILSLPLKFDINRSILRLTVTKRGRFVGNIHIKPWTLFGSSKFIQELGDFCIGNPRKIGRRIVKSTSDTFVSLKMKNAMFQPVVPDLLNYSIWLDSERAEKSCQVGITGIQSSSSRGGNRRVTGWQFVFLLRDMSPGNRQQPKKSLRFGDVVQGIDVVKSLCCSRILSSHFSDGLRLTLEAV